MSRSGIVYPEEAVDEAYRLGMKDGEEVGELRGSWKGFIWGVLFGAVVAFVMQLAAKGWGP